MSDAEQIFNRFKPMAEIHDVLIESFLLNELKEGKSKKAIEFGAGHAAWPLTMNHLGFKSPSWHLVENFSWAEENIKAGWAIDQES